MPTEVILAAKLAKVTDEEKSVNSIGYPSEHRKSKIER